MGTIITYALLLLCMGLLISWAAPACNNPIFSEIVPPHLRTVIYAFDRSFESAIAASAAPLVGIMAESMFGWKVLFLFIDIATCDLRALNTILYRHSHTALPCLVRGVTEAM